MSNALALRALIDAGYEVAAVVVAQKEAGKSRKARPLEVAEAAKEHGIPVLAPDDLLEARDKLAGYGAQAAVLIAYGKIVPREVLDIFPAGIVNIHPSLLPKHRGSTPIENAILAGEPETGVSLMKLSEKMDAGPLFAQGPALPLTQVSKQTVTDLLLAGGIDLLLEHLPGILDRTATAPRPQDESAATYDRLLHKKDGVVDWHKSAERLEREVRAYAGWPRSRATIGKTEVILTKAAIADGAGTPGSVRTGGGKLVVCCGQGALEIERLVPAGKQEMTGQAFIAGYQPL